ncbi:hypothetical protein K457DRAFT_34386 [Linnemannia elongata AG-77]|uniref:Uncharacterized protein n=1 Tax=Linnemannia elongata AG-77 TaxID=1314771 RepID=A0A197JQ74_9FUNG|nr:hypothetical protein K457DRAFT_34386 [Linnemannia elongata AG-77]
MYCNNCCLCLPIRGGGMWLSGFVFVINAAGSICLFLWGTFFFSSSAICAIVAGFSVVQAVTAAIAFIAQLNWSYMLTRMYVFVQWLVMFLSVGRIGLVAYELALNKDRIQGACLDPSAYTTVVVEGDGSSTIKLPPTFYCGTKVDTFVLVVVAGMAVDWLLNGYLYFVLWRFYTKMRLYPEAVKNADSGFSYEEALDEV